MPPYGPRGRISRRCISASRHGVGRIGRLSPWHMRSCAVSFTCSRVRNPTANKYPPAEPEVLRLLAPRRGLTAIAKSKAKNQEDDEQQTPGTVKLWESPGRAGGLPGLNYVERYSRY